MANKTLFTSIFGGMVPRPDTVNLAGAPAYAMPPKHALAQYVSTGCFGHTFYSTAESQLERVLDLCDAVPVEYVAKLAVYGREQAFMKDTPALLCAWLSLRAPQLHENVFVKVVDNARMLRTYIQILRSGVVGRKSLGSAPKRLVRDWLAAQSEEALFRGSTGHDPSFVDVLKMVHPKPSDARREAFYGYMIGRVHNAGALPELVLQFEQFKTGNSQDVPDVPFLMLSSLPLSRGHWVDIALRASRQTTRMNLNTFVRHGVFDEPGVAEMIADKLRDPEAIRRARVFPYQLLAAFTNAVGEVPAVVLEALQDAMEVAVSNVPGIDGKVFLCPDVSGSMESAVTGHRAGSTSKVRCVDIAALVTAAVLRKNPEAEVLPFAEDVRAVRINPRDSIMTNAARLSALLGGGTNCSAPLKRMNAADAQADVVIFVSDNQSWVDARQGGTEFMVQWQHLRQRNPKARLVCVDIQPYETTQAQERADVLNIGGFSDDVFSMIADFASGNLDTGHWVDRVEAVMV